MDAALKTKFSFQLTLEGETSWVSIGVSRNTANLNENGCVNN